jgi:hypothetical protein
MIRKLASSMPGYVRILFELPSCLWADRIFLVGDFNQWNETATPMHQDRDGVWRVVIDLPQGGSYEFRYLIDGQWTSDSHADGFAQNNFGVSNSIVHAMLPIAAMWGTESQLREISLRHALKGTSLITPPGHSAQQSAYPHHEPQRTPLPASTRIAA